MGMGRVLVYGGHGALGRAIVSAFRSKNWGAVAADFSAGGCNLGDIQLNREENADGHVRQVRETLGTQKLDCIVHAAGGWIPGDVQGDLSAFETMWRMNSMSALATAHIASHHLKENGLLVLTGAHVALNACASMHSYAVSKNAVHFLTKSLADPNCETLPSGAIAVAVLP